MDGSVDGLISMFPGFCNIDVQDLEIFPIVFENRCVYTYDSSWTASRCILSIDAYNFLSNNTNAIFL